LWLTPNPTHWQFDCKEIKIKNHVANAEWLWLYCVVSRGNLKMTTDEQLETLSQRFLDAKAHEGEATKARVAIEEEIVALIRPNKEGQTSLRLGSGYKLTITNKMIYKGDCDALEAMSETWPEEYKVVRIKKDLNETKLREIRTYRPEVWLRMSEVITMKPAKVSVKVERIEE
jgi:hypothetical protein